MVASGCQRTRAVRELSSRKLPYGDWSEASRAVESIKKYIHTEEEIPENGKTRFEFKKEDPILAIMGTSGAGKSTFLHIAKEAPSRGIVGVNIGKNLANKI